MGMKSLKSGLGLLKNPVLWITPIICGILACFQMLLAFDDSGIFFGEKLGIMWLFIMPFFLAATYGCINKSEFTIRSFMNEGFRGYFKILLPGFLLFFVAAIIIIFASAPAMAGLGGIYMFLMLALVFVPFLILTFFYDTAAIFEGKKVFDSIKRSYEVVVQKPPEVISFFAVIFLLSVIVGFGLMVLWSGAMTEQLMPLMDMSDSELNELSADPEAFLEIIGDYGVMVTSIFYSFAVFLSVLIILRYKAVFYRDFLMPVRAEETVIEDTGEYDEKGRWYKYS